MTIISGTALTPTRLLVGFADACPMQPLPRRPDKLESWVFISEACQLMVPDDSQTTAEAAIAWMRGWKAAGPALERVRRRELRNLDGPQTLGLLTGFADYRAEPRKARQASGLVEQQRWFMKARGHA